MKKKTLTLNPLDKKSTIHREIYSNFTEHLGRCIYDGIYVGKDSPVPNIEGFRKDIVDAFKEIKVPVLRWPGGCFADTYHWTDGIGPVENRKKMINDWGQVLEDNSFGTHEFLRFCELVGCEPYISGNVGSGTVQELSDWIEYMTYKETSPMVELRHKNGQENPWKIKYLGIGNESWGCGGNMEPEFYCNNYKQYATFCRNYSGNELYKIACGPSADDYNWTEVCMKKIGPDRMNGLSLHYYTLPTGNWEHKGSSTDFTEKEYYDTLKSTYKMEELIVRHSEIMNRYDPDCKVALIVDEWGCWYDVEPGTNPGFLYQLNTMRDAIIAAINLNLFNHYSKRVRMANIAQAVNVLQAIVLTEGNITVKTPTYHVFDLFKNHMDNTLIYSHIDTDYTPDQIPTISQSASMDEKGNIVITLANCSLSEEYTVNLRGLGTVKKASGRILCDEVHTCNTFDSPNKCSIKELSVSLNGQEPSVILPACSVAEIVLEVEQ